MPATIEYREGIFYVNSARVTFPKDAQHQSAPVLMGLDYNTGNIVPASFSSDGKLNVGGVTFEGEITLGSLVLEGRHTDIGWEKISILPDGSGHGAMFVQSVNMATSVKQDAQSALLTTIDNSINTKINVTTGQLKGVLDAIELILDDQLDIPLTDLQTALGVINTSINVQVDMKTSVLGGKLDTANTHLTTINTSINTQIDTKTSVLNTSIAGITTAINTQIDTKTSVLSTNIQAITTAINTQIDTKTSVLNTSLGSINTSIGSTNTKLDTVITDLGHLTDKTQETKITNGTDSVSITDVSGAKALDVYMKGGVSLSVTLSHTTDSIQVYGNDGSNDKLLKTNVSGQLEVIVISSALPSGAATDTTVGGVTTAINTQIDTKTSVLDTSLGTINTSVGGVTTAVNTQIDTKTSVLNTSIAAVTTAVNKVVSDSPMNKANIKAEYTYVASGNGVGKVETIKEYPTAAIGGDPAKLTTYTYNADNKVLTITVTDTTV